MGRVCFKSNKPNISNLEANKIISKGLRADENHSYEDISIEILDCQVKWLRNKEFATVKVLCRNYFVEGATWEVEAHMDQITSLIQFLWVDILFLCPILLLRLKVLVH